MSYNLFSKILLIVFLEMENEDFKIEKSDISS